MRAIGDCLKTSFRDEDIPCRFGGEEFVVILPGATSAAVAQKAEDIRSRVESLVVRYVDGNLPRITISVGVAAFPYSGDSPQAVLKAADEALYRAKEDGRNRVQLSASLSPSPSSSMGPAVALQRGLAANFGAAEETGDRAAAAWADAV